MNYIFVKLTANLNCKTSLFKNKQKKIMSTNKILFTLIATSLLIACGSDDTTTTTTTNSERYLYTSTNSTAGNKIIQLSIGSNGLVTEVDQGSDTTIVQAFSTGGKGDSADGDFDGQNSLIIVGNYLLAVNAGTDTVNGDNGNGSISVFTINSSTGGLTQVDQSSIVEGTQNIGSNGVRPVSLSAQTIGGKTWVLVANQHSNPHYEDEATDRDTLTNSLGATFTLASLTDSASRNITAFEFNSGVLSSPTIVDTYRSATWGGPSQVAFSPNGEKVAVTTWGIAQFNGNGSTNVQLTDARIQQPSRVYFYDATTTGGNLVLSKAGIFEKTGLSGSIGFSWGKDSDRVFVANFNLAATGTLTTDITTDSGVTVLNANTATGTNTFNTLLSSSNPSGSSNEVCWTWLSSDNTRLYTASFASNKVSYFSVANDASSTLTHQQSLVRQGIQVPGGDTKDMWVTSNSQFYVVGALQTHTVSSYNVLSGGTLNEQTASPYLIPSSLDNLGNTASMFEEAYLGLVGY